MTLSLILASCLLGVSAAALVLWLCERHRKRRDNLAAANRIMDSWRPKPTSRNPRNGQYRRSYGSFTPSNRL